MEYLMNKIMAINKYNECIPFIPPKIEYLKISELEVNKYYTCGLSDLKIFITEIGCENNNYLVARGKYFYNGEYYCYNYYDYMLY